jgi:hypothetical protein
MKQDNQKLIIYGGAVLLAYFGVLKPILNKLGITKSKEAKTIEEQENKTNKENPFSPVFYKLAPSGSKLLTNKSFLWISTFH